MILNDGKIERLKSDWVQLLIVYLFLKFLTKTPAYHGTSASCQSASHALILNTLSICGSFASAHTNTCVYKRYGRKEILFPLGRELFVLDVTWPPGSFSLMTFTFSSSDTCFLAEAMIIRSVTYEKLMESISEENRWNRKENCISCVVGSSLISWQFSPGLNHMELNLLC